MNAATTLHWLTNLRNLGSALGLERTQILLERLGNPQNFCPYFHIAGTNGKGSTSVMIESIQRAHGRRTGLYTSPHLIELGERIQINREPITENRLIDLVEQLRIHYEFLHQTHPELDATFFELMTAVAWTKFREAKVDLAIIETGLGGRLDATNVGRPTVCVITSIGMDHQEYLGNSIAEIAAEKAGILKSGVPCVVGFVPPEAEEVIRKRAKEVDAPLYFVRDRFKDELPLTNLKGQHQRQNAGAALLACELAGAFPINNDTAQAALQNVEWPARWQEIKLQEGRTLIIDGSHNEEGINSTSVLLSELKSPTVILGSISLVRAEALIKTVANYAGEIILVSINHERAITSEELKKLVPKTFSGKIRLSTVKELFPEPHQCLVTASAVAVIGSLYLAGEVLAYYHGKKLNPHLQDKLIKRP
jgi:dihydrofolate synthase/folylpolyglutamate synthase